MTPIRLPYTSLPGISAGLLSEHYELYLGYIDRLGNVTAAMQEEGDPQLVNLLAGQAGFLRNAIRLHELYFENLTPAGGGRPTLPQTLLDTAWGLGIASTGWVIIGRDLRTGEPIILTMPNHKTGYVVDVNPLLVLDCYEHAYARDYGIDKAAYLQAFFSNVNWDAVARRDVQ